ncbi:hypothetical protein N0M98_31270 [Paenibacillus doosanensis]|nr:hypothetical protein [Paenibacillus konkukensis]MCS7464580.1 hypothetical protein [Paenibacillus doosanensis]
MRLISPTAIKQPIRESVTLRRSGGEGLRAGELARQAAERAKSAR